MVVTLRDVAVQAGVSAATASRALTPGAPVSAHTRDRVLAAVDALGYTGNSAARSLRTSRSDTIGLLIPDVRNPFFTDLAYAIDKASADAGKTVMMGNADEDGTAQDRYLGVLDRHQVDGLLLVPQGETGPALQRAVERHPTVCIDREAGLDVPVIASDSATGMTDLADHIVALGHRRVAMVSGPLSASTGRERLDAARRRFDEHGLDLDVIEGDFQRESGERAARHLLDRQTTPDAVIAADALMALGVLRVFRERGIRLGTDIGLAAVDDNPWFEVLDTPVTVVAQNTAELGRCAVSALLDAIDGRPAPVPRVPTTLVIRRSLGESNDHPKEASDG